MVLGLSRADVTQVYAERDQRFAAKNMSAVGVMWRVPGRLTSRDTNATDKLLQFRNSEDHLSDWNRAPEPVEYVHEREGCLA